MYVYDFLELIECNLLRQWCKYVQQRKRGGGPKITIPNLMMEVRELILDVTGKDITGTTRPRGQNDIGRNRNREEHTYRFWDDSVLSGMLKPLPELKHSFFRSDIGVALDIHHIIHPAIQFIFSPFINARRHNRSCAGRKPCL
ncbi:uncharacterized protein PITG_04555 [Phytophthora infestans T30-4]|uniref:Uncharacterized protein n=1 Tax=Phytophthora infestans (strain T30-4) TaxID=403677 RepID=D0N1I1_PHYIT|nr:uncharacterized protein PITG_04555 [Phytophthora infestans T30-4]EEY68160.1 hypothetical protein PITG_04555 [Phytophthora infestans T30-4]|eukprot:XP_002905319.1 hypothetical protein PITG_04555 [Phytophthora infestans T30-4]